MRSVTISIPDDLLAIIEAKVAGGRFADAGAYVETLIRRDMIEPELSVEELRAQLASSLQSGESQRQVPDIIAAAKARLRGDGRL